MRLLRNLCLTVLTIVAMLGASYGTILSIKGIAIVLSEPDVITSGSCITAQPPAVIEQGDTTTILVPLSDTRSITIVASSDANTTLVPDRWKNGKVDGYASLPIVPMDGEGIYQLRLPEREHSLYLGRVTVECWTPDTVMVTLFYKRFDWSLDIGQTIFATLRVGL